VSSGHDKTRTRMGGKTSKYKRRQKCRDKDKTNQDKRKQDQHKDHEQNKASERRDLKQTRTRSQWIKNFTFLNHTKTHRHDARTRHKTRQDKDKSPRQYIRQDMPRHDKIQEKRRPDKDKALRDKDKHRRQDRYETRQDSRRDQDKLETNKIGWVGRGGGSAN
jgi:hypothetical protein